MSRGVSHVQPGFLLKTKEIQGNLQELSNLEGSDYSLQTTMDALEANQKDIHLKLREAQNNDNRKQKQEKMVGGKYSSSRCNASWKMQISQETESIKEK